MTLDLKRRLGLILAYEEDPPVDWAVVKAMSDELATLAEGEAPLVVGSYLSEADKRQSDPVFAHAQRTELLRYLRS